MSDDRRLRFAGDARRRQESVDSEPLDEAQRYGRRPPPGKVRRSLALAGGAGRRRQEVPAPGKVSLLSRLYSSSSDTRGENDREAREPAPFPHREVIERSFGHAVPAHAHIGPRAAEASRAQGAEAFAERGEVAFASRSPELHTAAHEAAHVLQETVGAAGAPKDLEAHAEQAAALVTAGRSAAHLFGGPAAAAELRRRPTGAPPAEPEEPEAPGVPYKLFKEATLAPGMTVSASVVFGNAAKPSKAPEVKAEGIGGEWNLDKLKKSAGKQQRLVERMRDSMSTRFAGVKFEKQFELEGLPDLKVEISTKLQAEGLKPGGVVEGTFSGDVTEFAAKQGWIGPADPAGIWLDGKLSIRVEAEDVARLTLLLRARGHAFEAADVIGRADEALGDLEEKRRAVAVRREAVSKKIDPTLWDELDGEHRALQDEIRNRKGIRGAARKRFDAAMKRIDDVSRKAKRTLVRAFAKAVGKRVAEHALKVIPVVGWISWASDAWEFGKVFWKLFMEDHATGDSAEGKKGSASGGTVGEERENAAPGDGKAGGEVESDGQGGDSPGSKADGGQAHRAADAGAGPDSDRGPDPKILHAAARAVYDVVITRGGEKDASIDTIWLEALDQVIPRDLPARKLKALCAALRASSTGRAGDPDQLLVGIAKTLDSVLRDRPDEGPRQAGPEAERGPGREQQQESVLTELPPSRLVEWKDGKPRPTEMVEQLPGLPFRLADGTVAEIVEVRVVPGDRPAESEVVPFRITIKLRRPDGTTSTVIQQHAMEAEVGEDGRRDVFNKGDDDIAPLLRPLIDHDPSGKVSLKPGTTRTIAYAGATLVVLSAATRKKKDIPSSIAIPGRTTTDAVVVLKAKGVERESQVVDDLGQVHRLTNGKSIDFVLRITTTYPK
jgi:Domain of unknown function (DUF4157)